MVRASVLSAGSGDTLRGNVRRKGKVRVRREEKQVKEEASKEAARKGPAGLQMAMGKKEKVSGKMRKEEKAMGPKKVAGSAEEAITSGSVHKEVVKVVEKAKD